MTIRCLSIFIFVLFAQSAFAERSVVALDGSRSLVIDRDKDDTKLWLVFLPGSGCGLYDPNDQENWLSETREQFQSKRFAPSTLIINKAGVQLDGSCDAIEFNSAAVRDRRIRDVKRVMDHEISKNAKIILVGESEGAYLAPDIMLTDKRVQGLMLLSSGTRSWIDEEISFVPKEKQKDLREFFDTKVSPNPCLTEFYHGWSYAQLVSYDTRQTYDSLLKSDRAVLMLNGSEDKMTWVQATKADVSVLVRREKKTNIEFHLITGAAHSLECEGALGCDATSVHNKVVSRIHDFVGRLKF